MDEIKPCPFCGGEAKLKQLATGHNGGHIINHYTVLCEKCRIQTSVGISDIYQDEHGVICIIKNGAEEVINIWNLRESEKTHENDAE